MGLVMWDHPWSYRAHWPHPTGQLNPEGGISCPGKHLIPEDWGRDRLVTRWQKCCAQVSISARHLAHCHAEVPEVRVVLQQHKKQQCKVQTFQNGPSANLYPDPDLNSISDQWQKFLWHLIRALKNPPLWILLHKLPVPSHTSVGDCSSLAV